MTVKANLTWTGDGSLFEGRSGSGHRVVIDVPALDGSRRGPGPKELTLLSLGGCSGVNLVSLMRKMRQPVERIEVDLAARMADQDPQVFTHIAMHWRFYGRGINPARVQKALDHVEAGYCGVLHMLNKTATVAMTFEVVEPGAGPGAVQPGP